MGVFSSPGGFQIAVLDYQPLRRFGFFQILLGGWPVGDGSTTAFYPHYLVLQQLADLVEGGEPHKRRRLSLGDTFDHLQVYVEVTDDAILFSLHPYPGGSDWHEAHVDKEEFLVVWEQAAACIEAIFAEADEA